jgi:rubrerythrin
VCFRRTTPFEDSGRATPFVKVIHARILTNNTDSVSAIDARGGNVMAMKCAACKYFTEENAPQSCPNCGAELKFT